MPALKSKLESILRAILVAVILFSAVAPALSMARPALAQGEEPTPIPTETITETPPAEPTDVPIETETPVPVATDMTETGELSAKVDAPQWNLSLASAPSFLSGTGTVTLHWAIEGNLTATGPLTLEISVPAGFEPKAEGATDQFDPASGVITTSVTTPQGQVQVQVNSVEQDASFSARLLNGTEILAVTSLIVPVHEQFEISVNGSSIQTLNDKVKVTIPAGALSEDIVLNAGFPTADHLPDGFSPKVFELTAHAKGDAALEIDHFNTQLTLEVDYSDLQLTEKQEDELYLYWYNEETGDWHALESYADKNTKTLRAYTDHFTVFDIGVNDWRADRLPTTDSFQVSKFTGAGTFSLPINVPPGPGGFQPNVTLSYNSQVVDQSTKKAQASWVGMGWSLDGGGSITENGDGEGYMLVVNGISTQLIQEAQNGNYHAMEENFWKIVRVDNGTDNSWKVFDTGGNLYLFDTLANYADFDQPSGITTSKPYAWYLTSVTNTHGQKIKYTYYFQSNYNVAGKRTDSAVYVSTILYVDERIRLNFKREERDDYPSSYETDPAVHLYQEKRLDYIVIEQDQNGDGTFETKVRQYDFTYIGEIGTTTTDQIWPEVSYSAGGKTLTLRSVQEWAGWNGTAWQNSLPPHTFTYDNLHLTSATNGYGGTVTFTYETQPWYSTTTPDGYEVGDANPCTNSWTVHSSAGGGCNVEIEFQERTLINGETSRNLLSGSTVGLRPGGVYEVTFTGTKTTGSTVNVGLMYRSTPNYTQLKPGNGFTYIVNPLDKTASTARPFFKTTGTGSFTYVKLKLLQSFYRVTQKTVSDGNGHTYVTRYSYLTPKVNSVDFEFRGHNLVTETGPDGTITKTTFYQDDARKGQVQQVEVFSPDGPKLRSKTVNVYGKTTLPEYPASGEYEHAWVHLDSQSTYLYDNAGAQIGGTRTVFTYDQNYGNLVTMQEYNNPDGSGAPYRTTTLTYTAPKNTASLYIVSALARQQVQNEYGYTLADTLYFYDGSTINGAAPTANILTMTRTLMDSGQYAQVNHGYDEWGNQTSVTTYTGYGTATNAPTVGTAVTSMTYDSIYHAYPVSTTNTLNQTVLVEYDYVKGVPTCESELLVSVSSTCPNTPGHTSADYDAFGRLTKLIRPGDTTSSPTILMAYIPPTLNTTSDVITTPFTTTITQKVNEPQNYTVQRMYDGMGREFYSESGGVKVSTIYENITGNITTTKQSLPYTGTTPAFFTTTEINAATLTSTVTAPDGTFTTSRQDGLVTTVTDARSNETVTTSDSWGRVISVRPPTGPSVGYLYDAANRLTAAIRAPLNEVQDCLTNPSHQTCPAARTVTLMYDNAGRKTQMIDPDMGTWTYTYDALGNLTRQTDTRGQRICLYYDALNRLTGKHYRTDDICPTSYPSLNVSYSYDYGINGLGRRTGMSSLSNGQTVTNLWTYDTRGRMTSETVNAGTAYTTQWTSYNSADLPSTMQYPDGEVVAFDYNNRMLLEKLHDTKGTPTDLTDDYYYVASTTYDEAGRIDSRTLGNNLTQDYSYYAWDEKATVDNVQTWQGGRLKNITVGSLQNMSYLYDAVGNIRQITNSVAIETNTYGYDALDRLTSWTLNGVTENYAYNATTGNLETKAGLTLEYNDAAHKHAVTDAGNNDYQYDANGNQITRVIGADTYTLLYDAENRLVEVKKNSLSIATFVYDGDGRRVKSVMGNETILFVGAHYEVKNPGSGPEVTKYYFAGASRMAMRTGSTLQYLLGDQLGSTSLVTSDTGSLVMETRYKPWGEVRYATANSTLPTRYTYTGQYSYINDEATDLGSAGFGLMFYNARWYDPSIGRFAQADTIIPLNQGIQAWDRFAYTNNNPVRYDDPSGHMVACDTGAGNGCDGGSVDDTVIFYLSGLGGHDIDPARPLTESGEYQFLYYALRRLVGSDNMVYIPLFKDYDLVGSHIDMAEEAWGIEKPQTNEVVNKIEDFMSDHPDMKLVIVGSSAGGTVAIEALDILKEKGIYVDQVILRGSYVSEPVLQNVGTVDYIAAEPPISDKWYSLDANPSDNVQVQEHIIPGFSGHVPPNSLVLQPITNAIYQAFFNAR